MKVCNKDVKARCFLKSKLLVQARKQMCVCVSDTVQQTLSSNDTPGSDLYLIIPHLLSVLASDPVAFLDGNTGAEQ